MYLREAAECISLVKLLFVVVYLLFGPCFVMQRVVSFLVLQSSRWGQESWPQKKHNDWLLADTCPQAANHCAFIFSLRMNSSFITSRPGCLTFIVFWISQQPKHQVPTISSIDKSLSRNRHIV